VDRFNANAAARRYGVENVGDARDGVATTAFAMNLVEFGNLDQAISPNAR
jgi:hypothetical protein